MELKEILKKIVLLGDGGVGKTSMIARYVVDRFDDKYIATIGTKVSRKDVQLVYPNLIVNLRMMIWDILGQKEYSKIRSASLTGAQGIILVGDLSRPETITSLDEFWLPETSKIVGHLPTIYVGNKLDLVSEESPSSKLLETSAAKKGAPVFLSSAKTGKNIELVFRTIGEMLVSDLVLSARKEKDNLPKTLTEAVDFIIQDFCAQYGDLEKAMLIVQHQFAEAKIDIRNPKYDSILDGLDRLMNAESIALSETVARVNYDERKKLIEHFKK
ncbi:MAG: GTP-binding protein [Thermoplasmata archaeon]|nr:GTP-binding protein [Thermoplasmata archaeon]